MLRKNVEYATQGENMLRKGENMLRNTGNMLRKSGEYATQKTSSDFFSEGLPRQYWESREEYATQN